MRPREAVQYLLECGALRDEEVVGSVVELRNVSRRNNGLTVACVPGPSFHIKEGVGDDRRRTVACEAGVLTDLSSALAAEPTKGSFLPELVAFDRDRCVLVTRLVPNGQSLIDLGRGRRFYSESVAQALGASLGRFHDLAGAAEFHCRQGGQDFVPFPLRAVEPELPMLLSLSAANVEVVRVVQNTDGFLPLLREVGVEWSADHLIHGDVRMDNCVLSGTGKQSHVTIVDWELAGRGDPSWDVGTVIAEYIAAWLLSIPIVRDTTAEHVFTSARYPLSAVQRAISTFAAAYARTCCADPGTRNERLRKAGRLAALRLVQIAFEQLQAATELTGQAVYLLQLSLNILRNSDQANEAFLGIGVA